MTASSRISMMVSMVFPISLWNILMGLISIYTKNSSKTTL